MKKKYLVKSAAALLVGLAAASCSEDWTVQQTEKVEEFSNNFQNLVMGDLEINPNQTWSTAAATQISVCVDLDYDEDYNVYIYETAPLVNPDAAFIGMATVKSGQTKTISVARSSSAALLYAACFDKNSHAICKTFPVKVSGTSVEFSNNDPSQSRTRSASTGYRWSVNVLNMPNLTTYTTGDLLEMKSEYNGNPMQADGTEKHLIISGNYSGSIARIQSYDKQSVYVTGTWTVPEDQRVTGGSVVVVGSTGKIVIPKGCMLSTNANNNAGTTGMIYVLPGGKIEGAGELQFSNGTETYSYNGGTITVANININGGTLYNAGTIGIDDASKWLTTTSSNTSMTGPGGTPTQPSKFINLGTAVFSQVDGAGMSFETACNMRVIGKLAIGNTSKIDNGGYVQCGTLELNGSNNGGIVLYMGKGASVDCIGDVSVNNFGVWGPASTDDYAYFKIGGCSYCNYTPTSDASFYMVDRVKLIIPSPFFAEDVKNFYTGGVAGQLVATHEDYPAALLFYGWYNGQGCEGINTNNYETKQVVTGYTDHGSWVETNYAYVTVLKENASAYKVAESRATCDWGSSITFTQEDGENCGITINKGKDPDPGEKKEDGTPVSANWVYYAFEDLGGTKDFDFNDVVIRVSVPVNGESTVQILAAGGELNSIVTYNGEEFGKEVHEALDAPAHTITNTGSSVSSSSFRTLGTLKNLPSDVVISNLPFGLNVLNSDGSVRNVIPSRRLGQSDTQSSTQSDYGQAPLYLVVNGDSNGKWYWPRELVSIVSAFPGFTTWASMLTDATWYKPSSSNGNTTQW